MKKTYLNPTLDVVEIGVKAQILEASPVPGAEGGNSDGGTSPVDVDPSQPGWDSDL